MTLRRTKMRADHEEVLAERNELKAEVARKNKEIEKLKAALVSAQEHLSKAIECLQEPTTTKTESPITPKQDTNPARKFGPRGLLKRSATYVDDHESSESHHPLKRSFRSAPERRTFEDS